MLQAADSVLTQLDDQPPAQSGLRLIIVYKLVKSIVFLFLALTLVTLAATGLMDRIHASLVSFGAHTTGAWSIAIAKRLIFATTRRHLYIIALAAALDGLLSLLESWCLHRRFAWSRWLVVIATTPLIPFEALELIRRFTLVRVVLLVANIFIVVYLLRRRIVPQPV